MKPVKLIERCLATMAIFALSSFAVAQSMNMDDAKWEYSITPYGWFPRIHGTLNFDTPSGSGGSPEVQINPSGYLSNLQFAGMVAGTAREGD